MESGRSQPQTSTRLSSSHGFSSIFLFASARNLVPHPSVAVSELTTAFDLAALGISH